MDIRDSLPPPDGDDSHSLSGNDGEDRALAPRAQQSLQPAVLDTSSREQDDELDLLAYWRMLVRRRWLILGTAAAVVALAVAWTLLMPSIYRATTVLQITNGGMQVMQVQGITQAPEWDPDFAKTQYQLLQSRDLAQRVAENLHIADSNIAARLTPPSWWDRLRSLWAPGGHATAGAHAATVASADPPASAAPASADASRHLRGATKLIEDGLSIDPIRNTHLVRIHYDSTSPRFSANVANAVADGFIAASMDREVGASSYASKYLSDQLNQLRSRLEGSERKLVAYAQKEKIVPTGKDTSLAAQNLTDLNASLATVQAKRIQAQALWDEVSHARGTALPADIMDAPVLQTLQTRLTQLQSKYQDQLKTFKPEYPTMTALKGRIDAVKQQINDELSTIRASIKAQYDAAVTQENMLTEQLAKLRSSALDVDSRSIKYNILKRDVDTDRQLYNALLQRYKQVSMAGGVRPSNIAVIDRAIVPTSRYKPSLPRNAALGLLLGLFLGVCAALMLEYLDDSIKAPEDVEKRLHLGLLGIIPRLGKDTTPAEAFRDLRSGFAESYRSVRTALQFSTDRGVPNTLLITSPAAGEGKSTSALALARNFAQLGKRVLLIEADLRNPSLARTLGLPSQVGLSTLLSGAATMSDAVATIEEDAGLDVIVAGPLPPSPAELLAGAKLVSLLTVASQKYDQVVIDGPPVLGIADAPILASIAAGTVLVLKAGTSPIGAAQAAIKRLRAARARLIGALLTHYDAHASGYAYDGYYYGDAPQLQELR